MKRQIKFLPKSTVLAIVTILITALSCSRNSEIVTDTKQIEAKHQLDSVIATIPTEIIENDEYTVKKYRNGRIDTIYKDQSQIKKKGSSKKSHNGGGDTGSGGFGETSYDFVDLSGPQGIDITTKIGRSFTGIRLEGDFVEVSLNAWIENGSSTEYPPSGAPITRYARMLYPSHSWGPSLPAPVVECVWSASIYQRVTVNGISNSETTSWRRYGTYSAARM